MNDDTTMSIRSHWDDLPDHPVEDWRYEVANGDTRLGYLAWAAARADADPDIYCRTCYKESAPGGDGWDGECPDCADKTENERVSTLPPPVPATIYNLRLNRAQAGIVGDACELFLRMKLGQLRSCLEYLPLQFRGSDTIHTDLDVAASIVGRHMPEGLNGGSASYGVTSPMLAPCAKVACDIHEVIRYRLAWDNLDCDSQPRLGVSYYEPMHWGAEPLTTMTKEDA